MDKRELGFTLVEVLISLMLLIVATTSLFTGLGHAFHHYGLAQGRWKATIEVWNQIEVLRADPPATGTPLLILPHSRPLYRSIIRDSRALGKSGWEILIAEK
ncbi:MAG: prepilin-type N-terminal cleavage/methylation domain-containing protein [Acidobacteriota bacterium]